MTYSTQGIVLKKIVSGETDAMVIIYTADFGKLCCYAQGIKKEGAKLKGHLESFSLGAIQFVLGSTNPRLTYAQVLESWPRIRNEFNRCAAAASMMELIDRYCLVGQHDASIWELLMTNLVTLNHESALDIPDVMNEFEKDFVRCLGYGGAKDMNLWGESVHNHFPWYIMEEMR